MNLSTYLSQLESIDLVRPARDADAAYVFRHQLTQETAYNSLLNKTRREIHQRVAETYEQLYADRLDEYAGLLAFHYSAAGADAKTFAYAARAGDVATGKYASAEAIANYTRALEIARKTPLGERGVAPARDASRLAQLYARLGRAFELRGEFDRALTTYEEMEQHARACGDREMELSALMARATIYCTPTSQVNAPRGNALCEQALVLARALGNRQAEARILWNQMNLHTFDGEPDQAVMYGEQSTEIARELGLREQLAFTLNDLSRSLGALGQIEKSRAVLVESRALWRDLNNLPMLADNLGRSARAFYALGLFDDAIAAAEEARQISEAIGNLWGQSFCRMFVSFVYFDRGEMARAIRCMEECIHYADQAGFVLGEIATRADLGLAFGMLGDVERGIALAESGAAQAQQRLPGFRSWPLACLARLHRLAGNIEAAAKIISAIYDSALKEDLATPVANHIQLAAAEVAVARQDYDRARAVLDEMLARLERTGLRAHRSDALLLKGRVLLAQTEIAQAQDTLRRARLEAESLNARRTLWQILAALSEVETHRGHADAARALREQARGIVAEIARNTPEDLRARFLNMPTVNRVLRDG